MKAARISLVFFALILFGQCETSSWTLFIRNVTFDGYTCNSDDVAFKEIIYKKTSGCAVHCERSNSCLSVFYNPATYLCVGCKVRISIDDTGITTGSLYYEKHACPDGTEIKREQSCYFASPADNLTFYQAVDYCEGKNAQLVQAETYAENQFLKNYFATRQFAGVWHGLTDVRVDGTWEWYSSGEPTAYIDWASIEPNGANEQNCCTFFGVYNWAWADDDCHDKPFINYTTFCEKRIGE